MSKLHENINLDMMIDRVVNSYVKLHDGTFPDLTKVQEIMHLIACIGGDSSNLDEYVAERFEKYSSNAKLVEELVKIPIIEQKSEEWHRVRQTIVTASDFAQALGEGKFGTQNEFLHKKSGYKVIPFDANCPPLKWGCMFEDVACAIYERRNSARVLPFGLIKHPSVAHFGASPDGITTLGVMVEIKCPFKRKISNEVPKQYYYQIQGQLDVCGLDECDYLECEFKCVPSIQDLAGMPEKVEIGCVLELVDGSYLYSPVLTSDDKGIADLESWIEEHSSENVKNKNIWYLEFTNTIRVYKDPDFITRKMAELAEVWGKVEAYRADKDLYDREIGDKSEKALRKIERENNAGKTSVKKLAGGAVVMSGYGFMDDE